MSKIKKWREADLNHRPSGYEPDELPDCSIPRRIYYNNSFFEEMQPQIENIFKLRVVFGILNRIREE